MVDAEDDEVRAVCQRLAVFAGAAGGSELIRADDVLGTEVAGAQAVGAADDLRGFLGGQVGLAERGADFAAERVVRSHGFVGALKDDDVLLALEGLDDGGFGERTNDVDVDGADAGAACLAQVIDGRLNVFRSRAEGDEHGIGVVGLVLGQQAVLAPGKLAEVLVGGFEHFEDGLDEVVAAGDDALHVMFLVLDGAEKQWVVQVDHRRNAAALGSEQDALGFGGGVDEVFRRAEEQADQLRLVLVEGALQVGGEEAVLDVHARGQR